MNEPEQAGTAIGIVVAAFPDENAGEEALKALKHAKKAKTVYFEDAAVIRQDADGGVHFHETGDMSTGKGAGAGALFGGLIGILGGPTGVVIGAGAGALVGGALAHDDGGFDDTGLQQLGVALKPGTSALALVISSAFLHEVRLRADAGEMRTALANIGAELSARLEEGKSVALGIALTGEGLVVSDFTADEKTTGVLGIILREDGLLAGEAVAAEETAAVTDEAVPKEIAVENDDQKKGGE